MFRGARFRLLGNDFIPILRTGACRRRRSRRRSRIRFFLRNARRRVFRYSAFRRRDRCGGIFVVFFGRPFEFPKGRRFLIRFYEPSVRPGTTVRIRSGSRARRSSGLGGGESVLNALKPQRFGVFRGNVPSDGFSENEIPRASRNFVTVRRVFERQRERNRAGVLLRRCADDPSREIQMSRGPFANRRSHRFARPGKMVFHPNPCRHFSGRSFAARIVPVRFLFLRGAASRFEAFLKRSERGIEQIRRLGRSHRPRPFIFPRYGGGLRNSSRGRGGFVFHYPRVLKNRDGVAGRPLGFLAALIAPYPALGAPSLCGNV